MLYLYRCPKCLTEKEVNHSMEECETHHEMCSACEGPPLEMIRVISGGFATIFRGKKWECKEGY